MSLIGSEIKNLRKAKCKSLRQVESETGVLSGHLSQIETGKILQPSDDILLKLSTYFGKDLGSLKAVEDEGHGNSTNLACRDISPFRVVQARHLMSFADRIEAGGKLPAIVRDLISSVADPIHIEMPVEESVDRTGWDGTIENYSGNLHQFVPQGKSCWEMGRGNEPQSKANGDFKKRTEKTSEIQQLKTTFVFLTLRRWKNKDLWIVKKKKESSWKDIRAYDAEDLELWLEKSPVVALELAKFLGNFPLSGAETLMSFWDDWFKSTEPGIDEELLLESGARCLFSMKNFLESDEERNTVYAKDLNVAVAFIYAAIGDVSSKTLRESLLSRTLVVDSKEAMEKLIHTESSLVLVPRFKGYNVQRITEKGHRLITISTQIVEGSVEKMERVSTETLFKYLTHEGGLIDYKARRIANGSHGDLNTLKMMLSDEVAVESPLWSHPGYGEDLVLMTLLGSWNTHSKDDMFYVKQFLNCEDDAQLESNLKRYTLLENSPIEKIGSTYVVKQDYAFNSLSKFLNSKKIHDFISLASAILTELDTSYELKKEDRYAASVYKKGLSCSPSLRKGVASSLALLTSVDLSNSGEIISLINNEVKVIFDNPDWKYWASLKDVQALLAEASPESFLSQLNKFAGEKCFVEILHQTHSMGGCDYAGVLWSLELCAWDRQYLKEATRALLLLQQSEDTKSNFINKPSNSLYSIYKIWRPQTNCSFEDRTVMLMSFYKDFPKEVWALLMRLVPKRHEHSSDNQRPKYRDVGSITVKSLNNRVLNEQIDLILEQVIQILKTDPDKWRDAFDLVVQVPSAHQKRKLLEAISSLDPSDLSEPIRRSFWEHIGDVYSDHKKFSTATWSLKGDMLKCLEVIYEKFTPENTVDKWLHVFNGYFRHPSLSKYESDYEKRNQAVLSLRIEALDEIYSDNPKLKIIDLIDLVSDGTYLGDAYGSFEKNSKMTESLIKRFDYKVSKKNKDFFEALVFRFFKKNSLKAIDELVPDSNKELKIYILQVLSFNPDIWKLVESKEEGFRREFWCTVKSRGYSNSFKDARFLLDRFKEVGRALLCFNVISDMLRMKVLDKVSGSEIMEHLERLTSSSIDSDEWESVQGMFAYNMKELLLYLNKRVDVDRKKLALIEWDFMKVFSFDEEPVTLTHEVLDNPSMFVDILKIAYKEDDLEDCDVNDEISEFNTDSISKAYNFLRKLRTLPGSAEGKSFNSERFRDWVFKARELSAQNKREKIFDHILGQLLAYATKDEEDGFWPNITVRDIIDKLRSEHLNSGLKIGLLNKRGVVTKSYFEGGSKERKLAEQFLLWAKNIELLWPETASTLRSLHEYYLNEAKREDDQADHDRIRFN